MMRSAEMNKFDAFLDKVANVVLEIISNEEHCQEYEDLLWGGIFPKGLRPWEFSELDIWIKEQEDTYEDFINSLSPDQYRDYFEEQTELQKAMWELELAS